MVDDDDDAVIKLETTPVERRTSWWSSNTFKIYCSHVLSSWGDRMWSFALGIYLYYLYPRSLQLTALYGFMSCISIIICGAQIGNWIDRTQRLKAAQVALFTQNLSVILCAALFIIKLEFNTAIDLIWGGWLEKIMVGVIISFGIAADLGSLATKIALEKDWIVILSEGDEHELAKINSIMRTIDLTTSILAPTIVGLIMSVAQKLYSALFIAGWNIFSVAIEYYLLVSIYKSMPQLVKKLPVMNSSSSDSESACLVDTENGTANKSSCGSNHDEDIPAAAAENKRRQTGNCKSWWTDLSKSLVVSGNAWKDYSNHYVRNAGIALALLYLTVLGFDHITRGFALSQGVSEYYLGIFTAVSAVFGISGSLSFPYLRKTFGKLTTGNIGFGSETASILLCFISIFMPGSPSNFLHKETTGNGNLTNSTTLQIFSAPKFNSFFELWHNNISIVLLLFGIILSRFGLWVADLSVSQIFQENIAEHQRGVLNGIQSSLSQGVNLIKFILVIALPNPETFAYLILISWFSVFLGWVSFMAFSCKRESLESINRTSNSNRDNNHIISQSPGPNIPDSKGSIKMETNNNV